MNALVYNYKFLVREVRSDLSVRGIVDMGFRLMQDRVIHVAGLTVEGEAEAKVKQLLDALLHPDQTTVGRHVIVATHAPSLNGKVYANFYVPCNNDRGAPITTRKASFVLVNVTEFVTAMGANGYSLDEATKIIRAVEPYDFPL